MAIGNQSGRDVEYEVQPPDPGGDLTATITASLLLTVSGGAFTAFGCLAEGGTTLTVVGLFLLAGALVAEAIALNRAKTGSPRLGSGGARIPLPLVESPHDHEFTPGTWVVFYETAANGGAMITQSPIIFDDVNCTVVLRQCPPPANQTLMADAKTFVEVIPSGP